jgi:hypothetical protein
MVRLFLGASMAAIVCASASAGLVDRNYSTAPRATTQQQFQIAQGRRNACPGGSFAACQKVPGETSRSCSRKC